MTKERCSVDATAITVRGRVEKLLKTPIYSGRATAIERIFCPYLIRRMSKEQVRDIIDLTNALLCRVLSP